MNYTARSHLSLYQYGEYRSKLREWAGTASATGALCQLSSTRCPGEYQRTIVERPNGRLAAFYHDVDTF